MRDGRLRWGVGSGLVLVCAIGTGCSLEKASTLAPSNAVLTVDAQAAFVATNTTTVITVRLRQTDGSPVPDGTEVVVTTSMGELDQQKLRVRNGEATVVFRAGPTSGTARITVTSGTVRSEVLVTIGSAPPGIVVVAAVPNVVPSGGGDVEIIATVSASNGTLVTNAPVTFSASAGTLAATQAVTNDRGEARTTLRTAETTTVRASVMGLESATTVRLRQSVSLRVTTSPGSPTAGETATVTASVSAADGRPASGRLRFVFGDGQARDLGSVNGTATTSYAWAGEGGYNLSAEFTDAEGFTTRETIRVTVLAKPGSPPGTPPPGPSPTPSPNPGGGGDQLDLRQVTWLHTDVSGWPITSTITDVTITRSEICVDHTGAGRFPTSQFGTIQVEGNVWVFANINGRWYGATYDWLRPGQVCKGVTGEELGRDQIRIAPMDASWPGPRSGEMVGFMVSARARDGVSAGRERTNVVLVRWP